MTVTMCAVHDSKYLIRHGTRHLALVASLSLLLMRTYRSKTQAGNFASRRGCAVGGSSSSSSSVVAAAAATALVVVAAPSASGALRGLLML